MILRSTLQPTTQVLNSMSDPQLPTPTPPGPDISFPPEPSGPMPGLGPNLSLISPLSPGMPSSHM